MERQHRFSEQGLFVVEQAVPPGGLRWANDAVERFIAGQVAAEQPAAGVARIPGDGGEYVVDINDLHPNLGAASLYLMGLPAVVEAARAACGEEVVCTHDWMVVKNAGDRQRVAWHQDFVHDGRYPAINIGIQLDDARGDAVRFVPGERWGAEDVCAVAERYGGDFDHPELITASVAAGGITVHDVLLVHGSPPLKHQRRRKTLYLEFRPLAMLDGHPVFSRERVALRRELLEVAQRIVERLGDVPDGDPMTLLLPEERALIDRLAAMPKPVEPANYCFR